MYLAIDIGGSKTLLAAFSSSGKLLDSIRYETPKDYQKFLAEIKVAFVDLKHESKYESCVVGVPGRIDRARGVAVAFGNLAWENIPLAKDIESITKLPVSIENDANLAGLSEAALIKHGYKKVLYVTISTGIGGVVITDGILRSDYVDMEFGHMIFDYEGKIQDWEDFASGHAIFSKYGKKASEISEPKIWRAISRDIALGLTNVIVNHTPDVVVIGGGVGTHFDKYADPLHEWLVHFSSKLVPVPELRKAIRAEEAVIYGCYEYALQNRR